mgnify:FL=1
MYFNFRIRIHFNDISGWLLSATPFNGALETYAYELSKLTAIVATKLWFPRSATFIKDTGSREAATEADCLDPENSIVISPQIDTATTVY